jgi:hypothetical protein
MPFAASLTSYIQGIQAAQLGFIRTSVDSYAFSALRNLQIAIHSWISRTGTSPVSDLICPKPFENVHATRSVYGKIFRNPHQAIHL